MKKYQISLFLLLVFGLANCKTLTFGKIKKIGDNSYALEVTESWSDKPGAYMAICQADASGNLDCVRGKDGGWSFGAVIEK